MIQDVFILKHTSSSRRSGRTIISLIEVFFANRDATEKLVKEKGLYSFYQDGHKECCDARKVDPLKRALNTVDAWITGQRKDQSPGTRANVPVIQKDPTFGTGNLIKFNPIGQLDFQTGMGLYKGE